ncbi:5333_t:CDS:1, partial [Funneliformis geosporum]
ITEKAIPIFEELHPDDISVFAFDNATSHVAYAEDAEDALITSRMNLKPGGKGKFKDRLMPNGS